MKAALPERIAARIRLLLASTPDPERAGRYLERLRDESPAAFDRVVSSPAALRCAVNVFAYSAFLSDAAMRTPERILQVANSGSFYRTLSVQEYGARLAEFLPFGTGPSGAAGLARFRRRQLLRIALRDVLGAATLADVTAELSNLAGAILDRAYREVRARLPDGPPGGFSVIALGKLGGEELNYSSDIDLMFVYGGAGKQFFHRLANEFTALLSAYTAEGQCYRVDLRLRPDGALGEICLSTEGAQAYYSGRARDWERQMLIKARVAAGEREPGEALLRFVEPLIYQTSLDFRAIEAVSETRQRLGEKAAASRGRTGGLDIKLMPGGIRDIEFLVQCLQLLHGGREPWVRHGGTMMGLSRLRDKGLLSDVEYGRLAAAYRFLRYLEHRLQMEHDRQTHTLPAGEEDLALLARKMPRECLPGESPAGMLLARLEAHREGVRELYDRVVHAHPADGEPASNVARALDRRAPELAEAVEAAGLDRGRERFEQFLERAFAAPDVLARLNADATLSAQVLDIFEHSPHFADGLLRDPSLLEEIGRPVEIAGCAPGNPAELRRFYRRQMLRIQTGSIVAGEPIFSTLRKTSELADCVIRAAYAIALAETPAGAAGAGEPRNSMMTMALGRLGTREFDLGSDADLLFVIPGGSAARQKFWTAVAERIVHILGAYTGEGVIFTVDTRLRPSGREGDLVQSEAAYKSYFAARAEAWEGIAYMKARAVAGDIERATAFLEELQALDWRRYGQRQRSRKELAEMRARLEREQGARNPLKAGAGGYFDIDFALMYLRLRGAGIFYKVLNTPERIDVIEKMGHLDAEDAAFLRDAATFYRALDHAQRVVSGRAEGSIPASASQLDLLGRLVRRWTPGHLHREPLDVTLSQVRQRTRQFFNRVFGNV